MPSLSSRTRWLSQKLLTATTSSTRRWRIASRLSYSQGSEAHSLLHTMEPSS